MHDWQMQSLMQQTADYARNKRAIEQQFNLEPQVVAQRLMKLEQEVATLKTRLELLENAPRMISSDPGYA